MLLFGIYSIIFCIVIFLAAKDMALGSYSDYPCPAELQPVPEAKMQIVRNKIYDYFGDYMFKYHDEDLYVYVTKAISIKTFNQQHTDSVHVMINGQDCSFRRSVRSRHFEIDDMVAIFYRKDRGRLKYMFIDWWD